MMALLQGVAEGVRSGPPDNVAYFRAAYIVAALVFGGYGAHLIRSATRMRARSDRTRSREA